MRRILVLLSIIVLLKTTSFSQIISEGTEQDLIVSAEQIKYANLIFAEHEKLLDENTLLNTEIKTLNELLSDLQKVDSIRKEQIQEYDRLEQDKLKQIEKLSKDLSKSRTSNKVWKIGCFTVSAGLLLFLLFK